MSTLDSNRGEGARGPLLDVRDVVMRFGGIVALDGISFAMKQGDIVGLIGPNGAGKTTLFNCLSGLYTPDSGEVMFAGESLLAPGAHLVAGLGVGRTFQNLALFQTMTVLENVMVGGHCGTKSDFLSNALRLPWALREEKALEARAWDLIRLLELEQVAELPVAALAFGTRKRVELARALATEPRLLLLDEPAGGLNHEEVAELSDLIRAIRDRQNLTVLLVEHNMGLVMRASDHVVALNFGRKIAEGTPAEVQSNPDVIKAYLGTSD